ncbi:MAG: hypothetical protein JXX14_16395 [Deltaproteobacteria bacterium]|nr:hypothetical protein [Deltaproteobacteria bacterium]
MKTHIWCVLTMTCVAMSHTACDTVNSQLNSGDDDSIQADTDTPGDDTAAYVYGTIEVNPGGVAQFQGSLAESRRTHAYGYCTRMGDTFEFTVGHTSARELDQVFMNEGIPAYLSIADVQGPPSEGVFALTDSVNGVPVPKQDYSLRTTFASAVLITQMDNWNIRSDEADCVVELFATPVSGELIFENDLNKSFDYYIRLGCNASVQGLNGTELNFFSAELYFENCD